MNDRRRYLTAAVLGTVALAGLVFGSVACGGEPTRLVTVKAGTGDGPILLEVKNLTSVGINNFYLARTESVSDNLDANSPEGQNVWGADLLGGAIPKGVRVPVAVPGAGRWDARATDRDGRFQHISGLKLQAGGRYILELNDGGWRSGP
jgi:hypothetical protein